MQGINDLILAIRAGYSYFYVQTYEMNKTIDTLVSEIDSYRNAEDKKVLIPEVWDFLEKQDPESITEDLEKNVPGKVVIAKNFHWFLKDDYDKPSKFFVSYLQNNVDKFTTKSERKVLIICGDEAFENAMPEVLQKDFMPIEFPLPSRDALETIFDYIEDSAKASDKYVAPDAETRETIIDNCKGLTEREATNALAYGLLKNEGKFDPDTIAKIRGREIEKTPGLSILDCKNTELLGYDVVKEFVSDFVNSDLGLGVMLLGPAGTGKTSFANNIGATSKKIVISLELAQLMGDGLVGQAEKAYKRALDIIKANAPCIVIIDEIEKGLSGTSSTGTDGGTTQRATSQLLKFLSDERPKGVYVIATCNNISQLPPEWIRSERWDCAPFFVDLPNENEREEIFEHYKKVFEIDDKENPDMKDWSGAEIKSLCRIAKVRGKGFIDAARFIKPVARTMAEQIQSLRQLVTQDKVVPASLPEIKKPSRRRKRQSNL